jgi:hypothetical protein
MLVTIFRLACDTDGKALYPAPIRFVPTLGHCVANNKQQLFAALHSALDRMHQASSRIQTVFNPHTHTHTQTHVGEGIHDMNCNSDSDMSTSSSSVSSPDNDDRMDTHTTMDDVLMQQHTHSSNNVSINISDYDITHNTHSTHNTHNTSHNTSGGDVGVEDDSPTRRELDADIMSDILHEVAEFNPDNYDDNNERINEHHNEQADIDRIDNVGDVDDIVDDADGNDTEEEGEDGDNEEDTTYDEDAYEDEDYDSGRIAQQVDHDHDVIGITEASQQDADVDVDDSSHSSSSLLSSPSTHSYSQSSESSKSGPSSSGSAAPSSYTDDFVAIDEDVGATDAPTDSNVANPTPTPTPTAGLIGVSPSNAIVNDDARGLDSYDSTLHHESYDESRAESVESIHTQSQFDAVNDESRIHGMGGHIDDEGRNDEEEYVIVSPPLPEPQAHEDTAAAHLSSGQPVEATAGDRALDVSMDESVSSGHDSLGSAEFAVNDSHQDTPGVTLVDDAVQTTPSLALMGLFETRGNDLSYDDTRNQRRLRELINAKIDIDDDSHRFAALETDTALLAAVRSSTSTSRLSAGSSLLLPPNVVRKLDKQRNAFRSNAQHHHHHRGLQLSFVEDETNRVSRIMLGSGK